MADTTGNGLSAEPGIASDISGTVKIKQVADEVKEEKENKDISPNAKDNKPAKPTKGLVDEPGNDKIVLSGGSGMMLQSPQEDDKVR